MKIVVNIKTKNDHLKNWLTSLGFNSSITENYDSISVEVSEEEIQTLVTAKSEKGDLGVLEEIIK